MIRKRINAFTLVEMLIVVIIIGILAAALLPKLKGAQKRARDTARKANLSQVSTALEMYFNDKGMYPSGQCLSDTQPALVPSYIGSLPRDPQKGRTTYGTKNQGCTQGDYGYAPLKRSGTKDAACVIVANIEAPGTVGNYILPKTPNNKALFSGAANDNARGSKNGGVTPDTQFTENELELADDNTLSEADVAEKAICSYVYVSGGATQSKGCWAPNGFTNGMAAANNYMVYVVFN